MSAKLTQRGEKAEEIQAFDLESLKRELWMRVLGMKGRVPNQTVADPKNGVTRGTDTSITSH